MTPSTEPMPPDSNSPGPESPVGESHPGSPDAGEQVEEQAEEQVELLTAPADGVPQVVVDEAALAETIDALRRGTGPVAVDAERAHGFRYSTRAYLIQLRRQGSGTHLVDPLGFAQPGAEADLSRLAEAIRDEEWIIHAATQDLPCLTEVGMVPQRLFDTELAGRLLGYPRVALGTLLEEQFGVRLLKEHSAADWSTRPLPENWLNYAALDVERLVELRDSLAAELDEAGKLGWAREEFADLIEHATDPVEARQDPWRRTSGIHKVRSPAQLAVVRELWLARDEIARKLDKSPGKILPDRAIAEVAQVKNASRDDLRKVPDFGRRTARRYEANWIGAMERASALPKSAHPPMHLASDAPPPPRTWPQRDPEAAERLSSARTAVTAEAGRLGLPTENLLTPDTLRRLCWRPPAPVTVASVDAFLAERGARRWQRELTAGLITEAFTSASS